MMRGVMNISSSFFVMFVASDRNNHPKAGSFRKPGIPCSCQLLGVLQDAADDDRVTVFHQDLRLGLVGRDGWA